MPIYNLIPGVDSRYSYGQDGTTVVVRISRSVKVRAIYAGGADLTFKWVSSGKTTSWVFQPALLQRTPATFTEQTDVDGSRLFNIVLGQVFPAIGFLKSDVSGVIRTPAIQFDVAEGHDIWLALLRSPWLPMKLEPEKSNLSISHGSAQATASLRVEQNGSLTAEVTSTGEGFQNIGLEITRFLGDFHINEPIGELASGMQVFGWAPTIRSFDCLFIANITMSMGEFVNFLATFGANISKGFLGSQRLAYNFILSDGVGVGYTLNLVGHRHLFQDVHDRTNIVFNW